MNRTLLIGALLLLYAAPVVERSGVGQGSGRGFDPLQPRPREVERAIASGRFPDALRVALDLQKSYPDEPLVDYWLATIHHGMNQAPAEVAAWEAFAHHSSAPEEACPSLPHAYEQLGDRTRALREYQRCTELDAQNPDRFVDLGDAAGRFGDHAAAFAAFSRASALDPTDPGVAERLLRLSRGAGSW